MEAKKAPNEEGSQRKGRHRKKQLYNLILKQMEFYFSDSNLSKDRFLSQLIQKDLFVELATFLRFNKIHKLTNDVEDIVKALSKSELLELSKDNTRIRRRLPINVKDNVDDCTIYVERLKSDVTHEWLTAIFSEFGNVVYVSIPKFKHNGMIKGFAFVEFEDDRGANAALSYFESINCKIPSHTEPQKLCSIVTYQAEVKNNDKEGAKVSRANKHNYHEIVEENGEDKTGGKKAKYAVKAAEDDENARQNCKKRKRSSSGEDDDVNVKRTMEANDNVELNGENETAEVQSEEKKKKNRKTHRKKVNLKEIGLHILSKKEWKKMRNRYLNTQRKTMQELKQHLYRTRFAKTHETDPNIQSEKTATAKDTSEKKEVTVKFVPKTIVKTSLSEPCYEPKVLKKELKNSFPGIKYVDVPIGSFDIYVRFCNAEAAEAFCLSNIKGESVILDGTEETSYWQKIDDRVMAKQTKNVKNNKQRGRNKLLKKAEQQTVRHIRFDENEGSC